MVRRPTQNVLCPVGSSSGAPKGPCFNCKQKGHFFRDCSYPLKIPVVNATHPSQPQGQPRQGVKPAPKRGRVNHITAESAQEDACVLLGNLLVNAHPTVVLFDFGASHSFIKKDFMIHPGMVSKPMYSRLHIEAPGVEFRSMIRPSLQILS